MTLRPYLGRLRTVDVEVEGLQVPFLLDTAGGVTLLTIETAEAVGCDAFGRDVGFRHNGEQVAFQRCRGVDLQIGGRDTEDSEVMVWDLMAQLQGAPEVGGIISLKSFDGKAITLDLGAGKLWLETPQSVESRIDDASPLEVRDARQGGGSSLDLFVAVETSNGPLWFELDSGALSPVLIAPHAAKILGYELDEEEATEVGLPVVGLGTVGVMARRQDDLIYDGLLNATFLESVVITMDLGEIRAWARRRVER